ncbi:MAG TPA: DUF4136 domain-containing protein [Blastocatellia bacterium]|nr:DUF4136 domain-containing protein [Blastocatellia bacterium]
MSKVKTVANTGRVLVYVLIVVLELCSIEITSPAQETSPRFASAVGRETSPDPAAILSTGRTLYVHSRTVLVKSEVIESELQKRSELKQAGLIITRDSAAADLIMEVRRSNFSTEYPYVVIDARTQIVVASGKANSLFGTAAAKIAKGFAKQVQKARKS